MKVQGRAPQHAPRAAPEVQLCIETFSVRAKP